MRTILTRVFTVVVLMMISVATWGQGEYVTVNIGKFDNGTITESQPQKQDGDQVIVTLTVEPKDGYSVLFSEIYIYETISPNLTRAGESPELGKRLYLDPPKGFEGKEITKATEFTVTVDDKFGVWVKSADFQKKRDDSKGPGADDNAPKGNDYSGTYYIANYDNGGYSSSDPYYLCPATNNLADDQPFLTTHKNLDGDDDKLFEWIVRFAKTEDFIDYYYLIHVSSNKEYYLTYNDKVGSLADTRVRVHLQSTKDDEKSLFYFEKGTLGDKKNYNIYPKSDKRSLNPAKANTDLYGGTNNSPANGAGGPWNGFYVGGLIGVYGSNDKTGLWYLEDIVETPTVSINGDGNAVISSSNDNATYYYTTDGTTKPTTDSSPYTSPINITGIETIKAIAVVNGEVSNVATYTVGNGILYLFQNQECTAYYMMPGPENSGNIPANTSSIANEKMEWLLRNAGVVNGLQYYYIAHKSTSNGITPNNYLYRTGNNIYVQNASSKLPTEDGYKFYLMYNTDGTYNIYPKDVMDKCLNKTSENVANNNIGLDAGTKATAKWSFVSSDVADKKSLFPAPPLTVSDDDETHYYHIQNVGKEGYYIIPPSDPDDYVAISNTSGDYTDVPWVIKKATSDEWLTYYYIINAATGKYMYFNGNNSLTDKYANALSMKDISESTNATEEKYQFILVWSTTANACYIVPKGYANNFRSSQYYGVWYDDQNTTVLKTIWSRASGANNVKWTFHEKTPLSFYFDPVITQDENGYVSITHPANACDYYYTIDGTTDPTIPADGADPVAPTYKYNGPFLPPLGTAKIKAQAAIKGNHSIVSGVVEYVIPPLTPPTISFDNTTNTVTIASLAGATIYYVYDSTDPADPTVDESVTHAPSPITFSISNKTYIKAIAVKDGFTPSAVKSVTIDKVATPVIDVTNDGKVKLTSNTPGATIYYTCSNEGEPADPTVSSTEYTAPLSNMSGYYFKAIAVKSDLINSDIGATSGAIKLKCAVPNFTRVGKGVSLASSFPASNVSYKYTIADNGAAPADPKVSGVTYNGTIDLSSYTPTIIVKAYAFAEGYDDSDISTFELTSWGTGTQNDPYYITTQEEFNAFITDVNSNSEASAYYKLTTDVSGGNAITTAFSGSFEGEANSEGVYPKISGLTHALFNTIDGGTVKNVMFDDVNISGGTNAGAIANVVTGTSSKKAAIYNCGVLSGSVSGSKYVGSIVGQLGDSDNNDNCYARVINCFSYAIVSGGSDMGGIVGYNSVASTQASLTTMVMNCMFYGNITDGGTISPIYGGEEIDNVEGGMNNYNYYRYDSPYSVEKRISKYNRALAMEEKFTNRFERYRLLLNSNRKLAAIYATGSAANADQMAKWILETADRQIANPMPYPVLRKREYNKKYPSIINYDAEHAPDNASVGRNHGGKLGKTLSVTIATSKSDGGQTWPEGASISKTSLTLQRTDKDFDRFNFNYDKVQLPYYNDVGNGNYTGNRVVTGWKIVSIDGGTPGTFKEADEWGGYNFADRNCTNKDKYSVSKRVFSQGAYWDVPKGVTAITIEPYWAIANYVSDATYDVVYDKDYDKKTFTTSEPFGKQYENNKNIDIYGDGNNNQKVYTSISNALAGFDNNSKTVYDQAVVLVGNVHQYANPTNADIPYTVMSIDMNHDNEPDYSYIFSHNNRRPISPIRYDFLNIMGIAEAQIPNGATLLRNVSIFNPKGWFEITNTCLVNFSQFEYENSQSSQNAVAKSPAPLILLGGTYEQIASTQKTSKPASTKYIHVGSNAWFAKFGNGTHSDGSGFTPHIPISVTGGDYDEFYLSGTYQPDAAVESDDAECYVSGGRFGEMAGASMEAIQGDVQWDINWADITNFYGGGVNAVNPITGNIQVDITNSYVNQYCGGPKFGDMVEGKTVITNATNCVFGTYFGAGYGGNAYKRLKYKDVKDTEPATHQGEYSNERGKYYNGETSSTSYGKKGKGVATDFDYEFFIWSTGETGARFYVNFITFSLATTHGVTSTLTNCKVTGNVYGGGSLGKVDGDVSTTLENCEVSGNVFGAGYSATLPKVDVRNTPAFITGKAPTKNMNIGMFEPGEINTTVKYEWKQVTSMPNNGESGMITEDGKNYVYTDTDLSALGTVTGDVHLTLNNTTVGESVYGGGEQSAVNGNTEVIVTGGTIGELPEGVTTFGATYGNVYGGGMGKAKNEEGESFDDLTLVKMGIVKGNTNVTINSGAIKHNVYGGGAFGSVGNFTFADAAYHEANPTVALGTIVGYPSSGGGGTTNVTIKGGTIGTTGMNNGMVFGSSRGDVATPGTDGVDPNDRMAWVYSTHVTIGDTGVETSPTIKGSVYGSGENGHTFQNTVVDIKKGIIGITTGNEITDNNGTPDDTSDDILYSGAQYPYRGNVYGGGCGTDTYWIDANENSEVDEGEKHYNPLAGIVRGTATVNISGGQVVHNVYGAGAMGSVGNDADPNSGKTTVNISGGRIGYTGERDGNVFGAARGEYGISTAASNLANVRESEVNICYTTTSAADNEGKTEQLIAGSVFGGGESGVVKGSVTVKMTGGLLLKDIYGGGALANTQTSNWDAAANSGAGDWATGKTSASTTTTIRLTGGTILGEAYGGGLGEAGKPAYVYGNVLLDLNGTTSSGEEGTPIANDARGCAVGEVFGCNNAAGTPMGQVMVHIYATQNKTKSQIANTAGETPVTDAKVKGSYDVKAVYGGGNLAAYEPAGGKNTTNSTNVIIDGCGLTSIQQVYGGGNAASTPATNVTVNGTFEIEEVFGGGNGKDDLPNGDPNPGANVGFRAYDVDATNAQTPEDRASNYGYGTGKASVNIFGGTIHRVFGGSNTKGNVRQTAVTILQDVDGCDFHVDEAYGGGKSAPMDAEAKLLMACIPGLKAAYGGAQDADIQDNVVLTITNGTFDRVFGGNNVSGNIHGTITVNVEETGCKPVIIGQLYGGGNLASYTAPWKDDNDHSKGRKDGPTINVKSFTSIGEIYGGGYGEAAVVTGDTYVNIDECVGKNASMETETRTIDGKSVTVSKNSGKTISFVVGKDEETGNNITETVSLPLHVAGKIGAVGTVYGGGNAAPVHGNTHVSIGTHETVTFETDYETEVVKENGAIVYETDGVTPKTQIVYESDGVTPKKKTVTVEGVDIRGNVYGAGYGSTAIVTGDTNVVIGKKAE